MAQTMTIEQQIEEWHNVSLQLRKNLRGLIYNMVKEAGGKIEFDNTDDDYEPVWITVEIDRHTGDMGNEQIDSIEISGDDFYVNTESNYEKGLMVSTLDLIEIYNRIKAQL